jgi:hypothetical protein
MYLLKGPVENNIMTVRTIYDLESPRNIGVSRVDGVEVQNYPSPPNEEGYGYVVRYNLNTSAYEYEAYEMPAPPEPVEPPDPNAPTYEELLEATNILLGEVEA